MNPNPQRNISAAESGVEPDQTLAAAAITGRPGRCCCFDQPRQRRSSKARVLPRLRMRRLHLQASSIQSVGPDIQHNRRHCFGVGVGTEICRATLCHCVLPLCLEPVCLCSEPGAAERGHADSSRPFARPSVVIISTRGLRNLVGERGLTAWPSERGRSG